MNNGDASTLGVDGRTQADGPPLEEIWPSSGG